MIDARGRPIARAEVALFTDSWGWIRKVTTRRSGWFTLNGLAPGVYRLQATDSRRAWDVTRRAPTDARVRVRAHSDAIPVMTLRRGASITGQVTLSRQDKAAGRAWVRASDEIGRTFEVRADHDGRFALGGLPRGTYRISAQDARYDWAGPTRKVGWLARGKSADVRLRLRTRTGTMSGLVLEGSRVARRSTWVTAIHRRTGQWTVVRARRGEVTLRGLLPGRYTIVVTGTAKWQGRTFTPRSRVRAGGTTHVRLRLNKPA